MIFLEILAGPEVVKLIWNDDDLAIVLDLLRPHIGPDMHHYVRMLTLWQKDTPAKDIVGKRMVADHVALKSAIEMVEKAKTEDQKLMEWLKDGQDKIKLVPEEPKKE